MKQFKYITLIDEKETKEAKEILKQKRKIYCWLYILPIILASIFYLAMLDVKHWVLFMILGSVFAGLILIMFFVYVGILEPYRKIVKIAKHNDRVRHDEKIRFNERKRLEIESDTYTKKDIINTINSKL